jgi:Ca2+-binding EF-hand superfamily protein
MSGLKRAKSEQTDRKKIKSVADDADVAYYRTLKSCFDKCNGNKDGTVPYKNASIQLQIFLEDIGVDVTEDNCKKLLKASSNKSKVTFEEFLFCFETFLRNAQKAGIDVKLPTFAGLTPPTGKFFINIY